MKGQSTRGSDVSVIFNWELLGSFAAALILLLAAGCATIKGQRTTGVPPSRLGDFLAGVAKVDITPLPGYPMGGHGIAATIGRGCWTRLHATAIYLQDARGSNSVLVSCDLWSMPAGLADKVAELVAQDPQGKIVGRQSLIVAATHTHQSPGNFSSNPAYNTLASPEPGFDRQLFDYLSRRIAAAVVQAISNVQPAKLALVVQTNYVPVARNRSMPAFLLDPEAKSILEQNAWIPEAKPTPEYPSPQASRAVDPRLRVLRIEGQQGLLALVGFLAMHPTTMSHETEVYTADVFGVAETEAEQALRSGTNPAPVVALFNGPEGDVSPLWEEQDRATSLQLGSKIAGALVRCASGGEPAGGNIDCFFAETSIAGRQFTDDCGHPRRTSSFAEAGASLVAGAEDGRTIFNYDGHVEGTRYTQIRTTNEGDKLDLLTFGLPVDLPTKIKALLSKLLKVPKTIPLEVCRVGDTLFATLPGEFTTTMGRRIELAIKRDNPDLKNVILIGLANEYLSYFATPEEYDSQQYEGASTLYGPAAGPFVQIELMQLAKDIHAGEKDVFPPAYRYVPGPETCFIPPKEINSLYNPDDGLANILQDPTDRLAYRGFPSIAWNDSWDLLIAKMKSGQLPVPRVWVESRSANGAWAPLSIHGSAEDNTGLDFVTSMAVSTPKEITWTVFWMPPAGIDKPGSFRLCALRADGKISTWQFRIPADCPIGP
jgi:neutral ceramidase